MGGNARLRSGKSAVKMYDLDSSTVGGGGGKMTPNNVSQYLRERGCITVSFITSQFAHARCCCELKTLLRFGPSFPGTIPVMKRAIGLYILLNERFFSSSQ